MASSPITLRLDDQMTRRIATIARRKHVSTSEVLREAVAAWLEKEERLVSVHDLIKDLIGRGRGLDSRASEDIGRKYSAHLKARWKQSQS
jgi:Arc/MetJ-type ribon-helix-helix transcriptional regulator